MPYLPPHDRPRFFRLAKQSATALKIPHFGQRSRNEKVFLNKLFSLLRQSVLSFLKCELLFFDPPRLVPVQLVVFIFFFREPCFMIDDSVHRLHIITKRVFCYYKYLPLGSRANF